MSNNSTNTGIDQLLSSLNAFVKYWGYLAGVYRDVDASFRLIRHPLIKALIAGEEVKINIDDLQLQIRNELLLDALSEVNESPVSGLLGRDNKEVVLYAQGVVTLWGNLESLVHDFLAQWFLYEPSARNAPGMDKIKVSFVEYDALTPSERASYIIDQLDDQIKGPFKRGISRFESILEVFGFGGIVSKDLSRTLFEMWSVRNVIVHRSGVADRRFVKDCPWLGIPIGDTIIISDQCYDRYASAAIAYVTQIITRLENRINPPPSAEGQGT